MGGHLMDVHFMGVCFMGASILGRVSVEVILWTCSCQAEIAARSKLQSNLLSLIPEVPPALVGEEGSHCLFSPILG